jgi:hypothetical protein
MARNLPTYRRGRASQASRNAANRSTRSDPARNLFAFIKYQRHRAAPASYRCDASIERQDMVDRALGPCKCPRDIARALATLPTLEDQSQTVPGADRRATRNPNELGKAALDFLERALQRI